MCLPKIVSDYGLEYRETYYTHTCPRQDLTEHQTRSVTMQEAIMVPCSPFPAPICIHAYRNHA